MRIKSFAKHTTIKSENNDGTFRAYYDVNCTDLIGTYWNLHLCDHTQDLQTDDPQHSIKTFKDPTMKPKSVKDTVTGLFKNINQIADNSPNKDIILECWVDVRDEDYNYYVKPK